MLPRVQTVDLRRDLSRNCNCTRASVVPRQEKHISHMLGRCNLNKGQAETSVTPAATLGDPSARLLKSTAGTKRGDTTTIRGGRDLSRL